MGEFMKAFKNDLAISLFGRSQDEAQDKAICVSCGGDASEFVDEVSQHEYSISGMCQKCQDEFFG